jgi:hypothetical protein
MSQTFLYCDYVLTLSQRMAASFGTISAKFGFDYGPEFEIVVCDMLRSVLPERFGICRGFIVNSQGDSAGDDIVIFDSSRFPTLQLRPVSSYARKEFVPVEAALCYIEAKHTIEISGQGANSVHKALRQVKKVKELAATRAPVPPGQLDLFININELFGDLVKITPSPYLPRILNPMFSMIFARRVRDKRNGRILGSVEEIHEAVNGLVIPDERAPDIIVLGEHNLIFPAIEEDGVKRYGSSFFLDNISIPVGMRVPDRAFGVAIFSLLAALDWIRLGRMSWQELIADALERKSVERLTIAVERTDTAQNARGPAAHR